MTRSPYEDMKTRKKICNEENEADEDDAYGRDEKDIGDEDDEGNREDQDEENERKRIREIRKSDNCSAQNKDKYLMSMYLYAIENFDVERITHKYLIVSHTENEGDSMHSCIEKERSRILKSGPIYVPSEIVTITKSAKKKGTPYSVTEMSTEDFVDWKKVSEVMGKNYNIDENGDKVSWNEFKVVMMD
ncbi:unnamed protein product [Phaedon cochleariae]|uniref:DUF7869 domain-containing protein n=1 Tax=Phaedon cochleariae TaxID=80249 RepID=A0A9N9S8C2_PHACE|nr:unnamed protein product [Phaedon cochleariae]